MAKWGAVTGKFKEHVGKDLIRAGLWVEALWYPSGKAPTAHWGEDFNNIYRVAISPDTKQADVICLGMDTIDAEAEGMYADTSQLPDWMQAKLAVLALMKVDPPQTKVEDVGMRVDENTYWVVGVRDNPKPTE